MALQMQRDQSGICLCQVSNRQNFQLFQDLHTGMPCHIQFSNRKRPHFYTDFFRKQGMYLVGLFKIRSHLCQQLIRRNSHIDRKTELLPNSVLDQHSRINRRIETFHRLCHIHIALIHTDLFNFFRKCPKIVHQHPAFFPVHLMIRRFYHQIRTLTKGIRNRFPCADAISFCRD